LAQDLLIPDTGGSKMTRFSSYKKGFLIYLFTWSLFLSGLISNLQALTPPKQADYCYLPPFVIDPNTPPNITIVYEKGSDILKRAYPINYISSFIYYGFFDSNAYYKWNNSGKYFEKTNCVPSATDLDCLSGNLLNWALMSSLDLSRKALVGFGWPDTGAGTSAGEVFTYSGNFNGNKTPISYGQWADGNSICIGTTLNIGGSNYTYSFKLSKSTGSNPTGLNIYRVSGSASPSCSGSSFVSGSVAMKFTNEKRIGIIQKYMDKDQDYKYDIDAPRFSIRRWNNGADKQSDIIAEATYGSDTNRNALFKAILTAISKAPPDDPQTSYLGLMMKDIINYYKGASATFIDNDGTTQTPYDWSRDPAKKCRKTFALFVTTGTYLGTDTDKLSSSACSGLTYTDAFPTNTCYGFNTDLSSQEGFQNIRTYILHTTFYGSGAGNEPQLRYAAYIGGGEYFKIDDPSKFEAKLEEAILNILASASSGSTVATLTTQTRGSSSLTQAYFYPRRTDNQLLKWTGYLRLFWSDVAANLREDTENYAYLDEKKDKILTFILDETISPPQYVGRLYEVKNERLYPEGLNRGAYLKINSCNPTDTGNEKKFNEDILAIWNAQNKVGTRSNPLGLKETSPDQRNIKIAIGNPSGFAVSGDFKDFTTALNSTLQPFWSYESYCSNNPNRWCFTNSDCNYCTVTGRACPGGSNSECNYCSGNTELICNIDTDCTIDYGACQLPPGYSKYCTNAPSVTCTADSECSAYAVCNTTAGTCQNNPGITCTTNTDCAGSCKGVCSGNSNRFCSSDADCKDNYGSCVTTSTCQTGFTCTSVCDTDCATSVIKYIRGYDKPSPKGGSFRIRHECKTSADCPSGSCVAGVCSGSDLPNTLKLGDIVYSTPRISPDDAINGYDTIYKDETYTEFINEIIKTKMPIIIVGANDGMVHAFKMAKLKDIIPPSTSDNGYQVSKFVDSLTDNDPPLDLGKEVWSYIPYNSIPYLKWYCQDDYCHIPMVDARFTVLDASINGDAGATRTKDSWKRLLIGAMGIGGKKIVTADGKNLSSSIFVIDITKPEDPTLLWERPLPDNTLTTSNPAVVRFGASDRNGSWYIIIGSGPSGITTNQLEYKSGNAYLYVFDLKTGELKNSIDTGLNGYAIGDIMAVDMDSDYNVDDLYFGTYKGTGSSQTGQIYRFRFRNDTTYYDNPGVWTNSMLSMVINVGRPIFASPEIATDASNNIWIYFGTGLYLTLEHARSTTDNEYIYAFRETEACWKGNGTCTTYQPNDFLDTTNVQMTGAIATKVRCYCLSDPATSSIVGTAISEHDCTVEDCSNPCGSNEATVVVDVKDATLSNGPSECNGKKDDEAIACMEELIKTSYKGWRRTLTGWKVFSRPFVGGGLVDITAFQPTSDVCSLGGNSHLIAVHYTTGTPFKKPAILMPSGVSGSINNLTIKASVDMGKGVPPIGESIVALALSGDTYSIITQFHGKIFANPLQPTVVHRSGYVLWRVE
jgi:hypothetical protein